MQNNYKSIQQNIYIYIYIKVGYIYIFKSEISWNGTSKLTEIFRSPKQTETNFETKLIILIETWWWQDQLEKSLEVGDQRELEKWELKSASLTLKYKPAIYNLPRN